MGEHDTCCSMHCCSYCHSLIRLQPSPTDVPRFKPEQQQQLPPVVSKQHLKGPMAKHRATARPAAGLCGGWGTSWTLICGGYVTRKTLIQAHGLKCWCCWCWLVRACVPSVQLQITCTATKGQASNRLKRGWRPNTELQLDQQLGFVRAGARAEPWSRHTDSGVACAAAGLSGLVSLLCCRSPAKQQSPTGKLHAQVGFVRHVRCGNS